MDSRLKRLFAAQEKSGVLMQAVNNRSGVPNSTIMRWKAGRPRRSDEVISKLETALSELIEQEIANLKIRRNRLKAAAEILSTPIDTQP